MPIQPRSAIQELAERIEAIDSSIKFHANEATACREGMESHTSSAAAARALRDEYTEILASLT